MKEVSKIYQVSPSGIAEHIPDKDGRIDWGIYLEDQADGLHVYVIKFYSEENSESDEVPLGSLDKFGSFWTADEEEAKLAFNLLREGFRRGFLSAKGFVLRKVDQIFSGYEPDEDE